MDLSLLLAIALLVGLVFGLRRYQFRRRAKARRSASPTPRAQLSAPVRRQTQRELLRLVGGNQALAQRLVEEIHHRHPDHTEQWCWEKAIYDIERDRRST
ncbi:MAG TPA: hypothetical protein IGR64_12095 [Leptolyngbyaceae cyanobacterium M65_K2018_010]|nr:hypothetical protein [Leptolyngbyaceae cyanobacterium M65_K2018_010]